MRYFSGVLLALLLTTHTHAADLGAVLPRSGAVESWKIREAPRVLPAEDAFDLVDGGAELYQEYGLEQVASAIYASTPQETIQVEVWQMRDSAAACGVYSVTRPDEGTPLGLGQEGTSAGYYLSFWSGSFYVSVTGSKDTPAIRTGVQALGVALAGQLPAVGKLPVPYAELPAAGLRVRRFVRGNIALSNVRGFEAALAFKVQEAAIAEYDKTRYAVLIFDSPERAASSFSAGVTKLGLTPPRESASAGKESATGKTASGLPMEVRRDNGTIFVRQGEPLTP